MDYKKVKKLRSKIIIPLDTAISLLKKHNGNVLTAEQEFHHDNVIAISKIAACDNETALTYYNACNTDKIKAIEKINAKEVIITTKENPIPKNEIGFILWPENADGEAYKTVKRNDAFIPTSDFEYIINEFRHVYPLENPWDKTIEESFDVCGHNVFDKNTARLIVEKINGMKSNTPKIQKFLQEVTQWLNDTLEYADVIVVYGNL